MKTDGPITFDQIVHKARETCLRDGYHGPILFAVGSKATLLMGIHEFPADAEQRAQGFYAMGQYAARQSQGALQHIAFVSEAWTVNAPIIDGKIPDKLPMPSESPDRIEILGIVGYSVRERRFDTVLFRMIRDDADKLIDLPMHLDTRAKSLWDARHPMLDAFMTGYNRTRKGKLN